MVARSRTPAAPPEEPGHRPVTGAAFWALMKRWGVPDDQALELIGQPPSPSGKRPRFALTTEQADRLELLRDIDRHATDIHQDAGAWLRRPNRSTVFGGRSPIAYMAREGKGGIEDVLRHLHMLAFGGSLAEKRNGRSLSLPDKGRLR
jgi:hypothetical protein